MPTLDEGPGRDTREEVKAGPGHSTMDAGQTETHHTSTHGYCERCEQHVAVVMKRRFAGAHTGGMQLQAVCASCGRVLQVH
jgi:ABC-type nickel/cobalt efflux system permease component RcnA